MPLGECRRIRSASPDLFLSVYEGHFATSHSHMNYYIDISSNKSSLREAGAIAKELANRYKYTHKVDTILCLDGTEVIGACLADALTAPDRYHANFGADIFVLTPEHTSGSQLIFRDNTAPMIKDKQVLILAASVSTGYTALSAVEAVRYYSGEPIGICAVFTAMNECAGLEVTSVFKTNDLPGYIMSPSARCPMCKQGIKLTALINSYGCSVL